ncbi:phage portal protein [Roseovarius sp. MMSF_3281]|uniref:phage portal protein n=1 Tax=Roseovarius sp. MMSF_3281 TaxID=3046694 RepID=UPI00273E279A|nr:phage portal protein [Roseovarius sp. MMSF_3281]
MINLMRAAFRGIKAELSAGESGWVALSGEQLFSDFGLLSNAGTTVSSETVLKLSSVWACVSRTAQLIATLPLDLMEKQPDGSRERIDNDLARILTVKPNGVQTSVEFWEGVVAHALLRGNGYAEKLTIGPRLVGLRPLLSVVPRRRGDGQFDYRVTENGRAYTLPAEKVLHLRGFGGGDGLGLSAVKYGVQSFGAALAADNTASTVFDNAMMPSGVLQSDQILTPEQRDQLQAMITTYSGSKKAGKIMTLEAGLSFDQLQMNPEDAQLLETRRFQVEDICRWFGMPPIIIGHAAEGQTMWGTGVESIMLSWLTTGINPMLRRIEARMNADLIPVGKRGRWYFEFNREAMLQMDSKSKSEFMAKMGQSGTMTANERREKLNLRRHPDPAADELLAQTALAPLKDLGKDET